jgi:hypothetical protein
MYQSQPATNETPDYGLSQKNRENLVPRRSVSGPTRQLSRSVLEQSIAAQSLLRRSSFRRPLEATLNCVLPWLAVANTVLALDLAMLEPACAHDRSKCGWPLQPGMSARRQGVKEPASSWSAARSQKRRDYCIKFVHMHIVNNFLVYAQELAGGVALRCPR